MKFVWAIIGFAFTYFPAVSQSSLGLRAGGHMAWQTVEGTDFNPEPVTGLTLGLVFETSVSNKLYFQPELTYLQKGFRTQAVNNIGQFFELEFRLDHVEMPLLAKYKAGTGVVQYYLTAGPTIGYAFNGTTIAYGNVKERFGPREWEDYSRLELGGSLGAGLQISRGRVRWLLDIRYSSSLHDLAKQDNATSFNRGFSLSSGFLSRL